MRDVLLLTPRTLAFAAVAALISACSSKDSCENDLQDFASMPLEFDTQFHRLQETLVTSERLAKLLQNVGTCIAVSDEEPPSKHDLLFVQAKQAGENTILVFYADGISDLSFGFLVNGRGEVIQRFSFGQ